MAEGLIRAVLDTSVLVPSGSRRQLQQLAELGLYQAVWSSWIVAELNRILTIRWLESNDCDLSASACRALSTAAKDMMRIMLGTFVLVDPPLPHDEPWEGLPDVDDAPIWGAAVASSSQFVVSEDTKHFPPADAEGRHRYHGVEYLGARDFIKFLLDQA